MLSRIDYPVIALGRDTSILSFADADALRHCTTHALLHAYYDGLRLFDASGRRFSVTAVHPPPRSLWRRFLDLIVGGRAPVELELSEPAGFDLEVLKREICEQVDLEPEFWAGAAGSPDAVKLRVGSSESFAELVRLF